MNRIATDPHWLRTLLLVGANEHRPDAELLDRFARYREQAAFEAILRRHGPLVWGVCRRTLSNPADADDAFQATFLVLVQNAGRVKHGGQLGPWLYGVAVKVARRVRDKSRRVPTCDPELAALLPERERPDPDAEWLAHLDRELHALPAKFRDPMVLCELQGLSRTAAAERLRLREGTLSSRLARGRILLRQRLLKYGTLLPAGGLATLLGTASTAPARLLGKTAESVAQVTAAGGILTGVVPASVARLTLEVTGMGLFKLKIATAMAVTLATLTVGLVAADGPKAAVPKPAAEVAKAAAVEKPAVIEGDLAAVQGLWDMTFPLTKTHAQEVIGQCLVDGNVFWLLPSKLRYAYRFDLRLTPGRNPKWIDLTTDGCSDIVTDQVAGVVSPCIYRVTADGWELAGLAGSSGVGKLRPAEFVNDDGVAPLRMRRPRAADAKPAEAPKELLGRWTVTRESYPHDNRSAIVDRAVGVVELTPEYFFIQRPTSDKRLVWDAAEYTLDATKTPKWIDLKFAAKSTDDTYGYGVYESTGDTLRVAYRVAVPRVFRTLEFKASLGEPTKVSEDVTMASAISCTLLELKRVKTP